MITPVGIRAAGARRWFAESVVLLALGAVGCGDDEPELPPLGAPFDCAEPIDLLDDLPDGVPRALGDVPHADSVVAHTAEQLVRGVPDAIGGGLCR